MVNVAYYEWGGWAGAQDQFWKQGANSPETKDLGGDRLGIAHLIFDRYRAEYEAIFGALDPGLGTDTSRFPLSGKPGDAAWEGMDPDDKEIVNRILANLGKAFEAYERRLISGNAPLDRYVAREFNALSSSAKRGLKLFIGKAGCDSCHQDQTFTDQGFHNTGVQQTVTPMDLGRWDDYAKLDNPFNGAGAYSDDPVAGADKLAGIVRDESMKGQYRTKSLRHVAHTGPYFHDGSVTTLEEVVRFYNRGGDPEGYPGTKDSLIVPLNLSETEILDLVAFLEALTGDPVEDRWTDPPGQ
jgi:cytochrome c peroxidase